MRPPNAERAVALLSFASFASSASLRGTDAVLPLLAAEFGTTAGAAAAVITSFSIAYGLLQVVHGPLGDKVGKYQLIFITSMLSLFGTLACALAPTLEMLVVARFAVGPPWARSSRSRWHGSGTSCPTTGASPCLRAS